MSTTALTGAEQDIQTLARSENFPVGSMLLPARLRPHVGRYYRFARTADDVADSPSLSSDEKIRLLNVMDAAVAGDHAPVAEEDTWLQQIGLNLHESLIELDIPLSVGRDLLIAFRWDSENRRYPEWDDLLSYCAYSANPVGRFLLGLNGEAVSNTASDALCTALQILNHIQDAKDDYVTLNRVYVPQNWLKSKGLSNQALARHCASPCLLDVFDEMMDRTAALLKEADALPGSITSRGLRMEASVIVSLAHRLHGRLHGADPIIREVGLKKLDFFASAVGGVASGFFRRAA